MKTPIRRSAIGLAMVAVIVTALGVAGASSASPERSSQRPISDLKLVYASAADSIGIFKAVGDGIVGDGKKLGIDIKRYDNNLDGPTALNNAQLMVQDKPDVAIDWNTVVGVGAAVGAQFTRNNIDCLAVNQQIPGCSWFNLSNKQFGLDAARVILPVAKQRGWNGKNTTVMMVVASANGTEVNNGPRYFYVTTAKTLPFFKRVTPAQITAQTTTIGGKNGVQIDCKSTIQGAYEAAKNVVSSIPKKNNILLYGSDTDCDLGAYRALVEAGYKNRLLTCGLGGTPEGLKELRTNPNYLCEGALFLQQWSPYILAMSTAIANGAKTPPLTSAPQVMLTKKTVNQYYKGNNVKVLPPLVANNKYLAKYGILQKLAKVKGLNTK